MPYPPTRTHTQSMTTLAIYATRAGPWQLKSAVHILITIKTTTES